MMCGGTKCVPHDCISFQCRFWRHPAGRKAHSGMTGSRGTWVLAPRNLVLLGRLPCWLPAAACRKASPWPVLVITRMAC